MMNDTSQTTISQDRVIPDKDIVMKMCICYEQEKPLDRFAPDKINARRKARCLELKQEIDRLEKLKDVT